MCIFTTDINKNNNAGERGRSEAWSSSEVRLHQSRSNLKIIVKTKELDDNEWNDPIVHVKQAKEDNGLLRG